MIHYAWEQAYKTIIPVLYQHVHVPTYNVTIDSDSVAKTIYPIRISLHLSERTETTLIPRFMRILYSFLTRMELSLFVVSLGIN